MRPSDISSDMTSEQDRTIAVRMSGGQFGAHSKLDHATDESGVINDAASENPRHSRPINTSRDDPRKSAKSLAFGNEEDEEEKVFHMDKEQEQELEARLT